MMGTPSAFGLRDRLSALGWLFVLTSLATAAYADEDLRSRAEAAFEAARAHTLKEPLGGRLDAVWHTDMLLKIRPDRRLQWWVDVRRPLLRRHESYRLVEPTAPLHPLPEDPGTGIDKFFVYLRAPFGSPPERALQYVRDYVTPEEQGYILTHQLAVLEWAKKAGLDLPPELRDRKPELLARIGAEHAADDTFSDLFVERMFFQVVYGDPSFEELERTVRIIVEAQTEPGVWAPPDASYTYDGELHETYVEPEHARKMAMVVLAEYLRRTGADTEPNPGAEREPEAASDLESQALWWAVVGIGILGVLWMVAHRLRR